jgi:hypothetical protein
MTSDFFIVPTAPDYFSVMAIDSLTTILPKWYAWAKRASASPILKNATYPFPQVTPKFLGTIVQNYRLRSGAPAPGFQRWVDEINTMVSSKLVPGFDKIGMMLPRQAYDTLGCRSRFLPGDDSRFCLAYCQIPGPSNARLRANA